jgi:hypothetical protein
VEHNYEKSIMCPVQDEDVDASPVELEEAVTMDEDDLSEDEEEEDDDEHDVSDVRHLLCLHHSLFVRHLVRLSYIVSLVTIDLTLARFLGCSFIKVFFPYI